jgi:putative endonuclease
VPPRHPSERRAAWWYRLRAYRVVATNVWVAGYELDLVATRGRTLVFCEVKSKSGPRFGDPLEMVTPEKQHRLRRAAAAWLGSQPELAGLAVGFDVIAVRDGRVQRIPQAF